MFGGQNEKMNETEGIVDILKDGAPPEKMIYLEVDGKRIGTIHLDSQERIGDPYRVLINIEPALYESGYEIEDTRTDEDKTHIKLRRREE